MYQPTEKPRIDFGNRLPPKEIKVRAGEPFDVKIPFIGSPPPTASWYKDNKEVRPSARVNVETGEEATTLDNKKAERGDSGEYKVTLANNQGEDSLTMKVVVLGKYYIKVQLHFHMYYVFVYRIPVKR